MDARHPVLVALFSDRLFFRLAVAPFARVAMLPLAFVYGVIPAIGVLVDPAPWGNAMLTVSVIVVFAAARAAFGVLSGVLPEVGPYADGFRSTFGWLGFRKAFVGTFALSVMFTTLPNALLSTAASTLGWDKGSGWQAPGASWMTVLGQSVVLGLFFAAAAATLAGLVALVGRHIRVAT